MLYNNSSRYTTIEPTSHSLVLLDLGRLELDVG